MMERIEMIDINIRSIEFMKDDYGDWEAIHKDTKERLLCEFSDPIHFDELKFKGNASATNILIDGFLYEELEGGDGIFVNTGKKYDGTDEEFLLGKGL